MNGRSSKHWAPSKFFWLLFTGEGNLWWKIREGYINFPEVQKLLGELCKGKALKEVRLVDVLFKYKQSWVYVPQGKLRLLAFKEKYHSAVAGHRGEKTISPQNGVKDVPLALHEGNYNSFSERLHECQVNRTSYQSKAAFWSRCLSRRSNGIVCVWTRWRVGRGHKGMIPSW